MAKLDKQQVTNLLTGLLVGAWLILLIVRIWVPIPQAVILDSAMPIIIGFWFSVKAMNGHDDTPGKHALDRGVAT